MPTNFLCYFLCIANILLISCQNKDAKSSHTYNYSIYNNKKIELKNLLSNADPNYQEVAEFLPKYLLILEEVKVDKNIEIKNLFDETANLALKLSQQKPDFEQSDLETYDQNIDEIIRSVDSILENLSKEARDKFDLEVFTILELLDSKKSKIHNKNQQEDVLDLEKKAQGLAAQIYSLAKNSDKLSAVNILIADADIFLLEVQNAKKVLDLEKADLLDQKAKKAYHACAQTALDETKLLQVIAQNAQKKAKAQKAIIDSQKISTFDLKQAMLAIKRSQSATVKAAKAYKSALGFYDAVKDLKFNKSQTDEVMKYALSIRKLADGLVNLSDAYATKNHADKESTEGLAYLAKEVFDSIVMSNKGLSISAAQQSSTDASQAVDKTINASEAFEKKKIEHSLEKIVELEKALNTSADLIKKLEDLITEADKKVSAARSVHKADQTEMPKSSAEDKIIGAQQGLANARAIFKQNADDLARSIGFIASAGFDQVRGDAAYAVNNKNAGEAKKLYASAEAGKKSLDKAILALEKFLSAQKNSAVESNLKTVLDKAKTNEQSALIALQKAKISVDEKVREERKIADDEALEERNKKNSLLYKLNPLNKIFGTKEENEEEANKKLLGVVKKHLEDPKYLVDNDKEFEVLLFATQEKFPQILNTYQDTKKLIDKRNALFKLQGLSAQVILEIINYRKNTDALEAISKIILDPQHKDVLIKREEFNKSLKKIAYLHNELEALKDIQPDSVQCKKAREILLILAKFAQADAPAKLALARDIELGQKTPKELYGSVGSNIATAFPPGSEGNPPSPLYLGETLDIAQLVNSHKFLKSLDEKYKDQYDILTDSLDSFVQHLNYNAKIFKKFYIKGIPVEDPKTQELKDATNLLREKIKEIIKKLDGINFGIKSISDMDSRARAENYSYALAGERSKQSLLVQCKRTLKNLDELEKFDDPSVKADRILRQDIHKYIIDRIISDLKTERYSLDFSAVSEAMFVQALRNILNTISKDKLNYYYEDFIKDIKTDLRVQGARLTGKIYIKDALVKDLVKKIDQDYRKKERDPWRL